MFDMLAQHPDVLLPRKTEELKWHEMCPLNKPACVIKEVNGVCMRAALASAQLFTCSGSQVSRA